VPSQGIKVHGHWVIEVRNPDGSLHLRREFENALTAEGKVGLAQLLSGSRGTVNHWIVTVVGCGSGTSCTISEPDDVVFVAGSTTFKNLTRQIQNSNELVLRGTVVAPGDGAVSAVGTIFYSTQSPFPVNFTGTSLAPSIPVSLSQTISIAVTITFS